MQFKELTVMNSNEFISTETSTISDVNPLGLTFVGSPGQVNELFKRNYKIIEDPVEAYDLLIDRLNRGYPESDIVIISLKNGFNSFFTGLQDPLFRMPMALNVIYVYESPDISAHGGLDLRSSNV